MVEQQRIEFLDWLRAVAALLVILGHSNNPIAPGGAIGVSIFFVLSGYLIASILLRENMLTPGNIAKFLLRRIARVYPMYAVQIAIVVGSFWILGSPNLQPAFSAVPGLLTFTSEPGSWTGYSFGILWTLSVEFWFYVTFPVVVLIAVRVGLLRTFLLGIAVSIAAKMLQTTSLTLTYYDHFLIGASVAALLAQEKLAIFASTAARNIAIVALVICATIPVSARDIAWHVQSFVAALAAAALVAHWYCRKPAISMPILRWIGIVSYSAYLMHAVILDYIIKTTGYHPQNIPTFLAVTFLVSATTYFFVERPVIRIAHSLLKFSPAQNRQLEQAPASR